MSQHLIRNAQFMTAIALGVGLPLVVFPEQMLAAWTDNATVVELGSNVLRLYVVGSIAVGFASVLYQGQVASGFSQVGVYFNAVALVWFPSLAVYLVHSNGLAGAAWTWMVYGGVSWGVLIATTFGTLLRGVGLTRYVRVVGLNLVAGAVVILGGREVLASWLVGGPAIVAAGGGLLGLVVAGSCLVLPSVLKLTDSHVNGRLPTIGAV
jgi:hypothetical protein